MLKMLDVIDKKTIELYASISVQPDDAPAIQQRCIERLDEFDFLKAKIEKLVEGTKVPADLLRPINDAEVSDFYYIKQELLIAFFRLEPKLELESKQKLTGEFVFDDLDFGHAIAQLKRDRHLVFSP